MKGLIRYRNRPAFWRFTVRRDRLPAEPQPRGSRSNRHAHGKKRGTGLALLLLGFVALQTGSCAGPRVAGTTPDDYRPTAMLNRAAPASQAPHPDGTFATQKEKLANLAAGWSAEKPDENSFFRPPAKRRAALGKALDDNSAALALLGDGFSLADLEILAWGRNRMVRSAERNLRATVEAYGQTTALDDLLRQYAAFTAGTMTGVGGGKMEGLAARFPFPALLALKGDIVTQEVRLASIDLEIARREAVTEARKAYAELLYNRSAEGITRETIELLHGMESSAAPRYETGSVGLRELTKARAGLARMQTELVTIGEERITIEARILALLDLPPGSHIGTPAAAAPLSSLPPAADLIARALKQRQEPAKTRAMIARMELMIEMAESEIHPGFTLNLSLTDAAALTQVGTIAMEEPFRVVTTAGEGFGTPKVPDYGLAQAYVRETRLRLAALQQELKSVEAETAMKVREAWFAEDKARREAALYGQRLSGLADLDEKTATRSLESGAAAFSDVLEAAMARLEIRLGTERRAADLAIARADLEAAVGSAW